MSNKPTMLDILTTLEISPAILEARANYFDTVADRNERAGRHDQVLRLRRNINKMRQEAKRLKKAVGRPTDPGKRLIVAAYARSR